MYTIYIETIMWILIYNLWLYVTKMRVLNNNSVVYNILFKKCLNLPTHYKNGREMFGIYKGFGRVIRGR